MRRICNGYASHNSCYFVTQGRQMSHSCEMSMVDYATKGRCALTELRVTRMKIELLCQEVVGWSALVLPSSLTRRRLCRRGKPDRDTYRRDASPFRKPQRQTPACLASQVRCVVQFNPTAVTNNSAVVRLITGAVDSLSWYWSSSDSVSSWVSPKAHER